MAQTKITPAVALVHQSIADYILDRAAGDDTGGYGEVLRVLGQLRRDDQVQVVVAMVRAGFPQSDGVNVLTLLRLPVPPAAAPSDRRTA